MGKDRRNMPSQERSIKDREQEIFDDLPPATGPVPAARPFAEYLRETPAAPLSSGVKAIFWIAGIAVILLLCAALWRAQHPRTTRTRRASRPAAADSRPDPARGPSPIASAPARPAGR
ncbi:hypothetical protein [Aquisphaera insulae]|uniref:hypothetical protein n=1 Tax=Aquisphaera insulae TaxID=2712864 RepID=UPI0013E9D10E|nr:hypothetical protein [Aquisphaera insulae]